MFIIYNPRTNFNSKEFYNNTKVIDIKTKQIPVKVYNSISLIERYYVLLRYMYNILIKELPNLLKKERL